MIDNDSKRLYINEINTIPGSNAFYLWKEANITYTKLIDMMVSEAKNDFYNKQKNQILYVSDVIKNAKNGTKIRK